MAMPTATPSAAPRAQVVGNAFVEQYYLILHQSPELVFKFYQDSSVLSRPEPNGVMTSVTTLQAINDKILSLDCMDYKVEITTADAQDSYKDGVTVLVTGWLIRKDDLRRKFTQSFFLAPQDKGYFVLNDIFGYVDDNESLENSPFPNGSIERELTAPVTPDPEPIQVPDYQVPEPATSIIEEDLANDVADSVVEVEVVAEPPVHSSQIDAHPVSGLASSTVQKDAPKKTYASIVKVMKGNIAPRSAPVPTKIFKVAPPMSSEQQSVGRNAKTPASESFAPNGNGAPESTSVEEGYSIYIRGLRLNATVSQVDEVFKKFGVIKPGGVQVRSNRVFCFGFVEFELQSSIHSAIEASPVTIGDRQAVVEEKKTTARGKSEIKRKKKKRHGSSECTKMDTKPLEDNSQDLFVKENHEEVNTGQKIKKQPLRSSENGEGNQSQLKSNLEMKVSNTSLGAPCPHVGTRRKLLILDLNGLLLDIVVVVPRGYKADQKIGIKSVFKRPFCDDFLKFCFERFEVGVWTSRTKRNMDDVLDFLMADTKHKLLFCWDQSHCTMTGINTIDNRHKPLVCKELRKLWDKHEPSLPWEKGEYNESNTLLLDDSPYKALLNPPNTAIFPYSYWLLDRNDNSLGPEGDIRLYLERIAAAEDVQKYVKQHPFGQPAITNTSSSWRFYCRVFDNFKRQLD